MLDIHGLNGFDVTDTTAHDKYNSMKICSLVAASLLAAVAATVEQVHLSLNGNPTEMVVSWVQKGSCSSASVSYGTTQGQPSSSAAATTYYWALYDRCMYEATMTALQGDTQYFYSLPDTVSASFINQHNRKGGRVYAVFADFGLANDISLNQLIDEGNAGVYDSIIHPGDFAYNLEYNKGKTGDDYLTAVQPFTSTHAYMGSPGNHESNGKTFENYKVRFHALTQTAKTSGSDSMMWYSFNDGLVHWISLDTELWYYGGTPAEIAAQYAWLKKDLAAVNRAVTPWVIAYGHKQDWMDSSNFTGLEALLQGAGVELYLCGHQHNYQRMLPYYDGTAHKECVSADLSTYTNCNYMTSIVVGSPGCSEKVSTGSGPTRASAVLLQEYGYGHLTVVNSTHLHWQWEQTGSPAALRGAAPVKDELWIVKQH